jgi:hypothetical protein
MILLIEKYFEGNWMFNRLMVFIYGSIVGALTILVK